MKKMILTLVLVLLVSGCTALEQFNPFAPSDAKVKELPPDVITVQKITVLPSPPIIAGDQFSLSFELTNLEENVDVDVGYYLSNWHLFETNEDARSIYETFPLAQKTS